MKKSFIAYVTVFVAFAFAYFGSGVSGANAQELFGKNKVQWEKIDCFYRSSHFDLYHSLDTKDSFQKDEIARLVNQLEGAHVFLSAYFDIRPKQRVPIVIYRTHSGFEASFIAGNEFMEEGVGAFAESVRRRVVGKLDFIPPLNNTIMSHELSHIFQFSFSSGFIGFVGDALRSRPSWFIEGMADFLANKFAPYTRDDIRGLPQRAAAANPEKDLPTWEALSEGEGNPYSHGSMFFEFLERRFGADVCREFIRRGLIDRYLSLERVLYEATGGVVDSTATFDRLNRQYWRKRYAQDALDATDPYDDSPNAAGRSLAPYNFPYPITSAVPSPDGKMIAGFSIQKNGLTPVVWSVPAESRFDASTQTQKSKTGKNTDFGEHLSGLESLVPSMPPIPMEYPIAQGLNAWPFNGSDLCWSPDGKTIAFFARKNKDHVLFLVNVEKRKIVKEFELPLDQAFSPEFSPTGEAVYFSAAKNLRRDIYRLDMASGEITNITEDGAFDTAPAVSPDGGKIAYVAFIGDYQKLFLLDMRSYEKRQLTFGRYNDTSPSFSRDGNFLVYCSDENKGVWNLRTIEIASGKIADWREVFGGVFTPHFAGDDPCRVVYTTYYQYDQFRSHIYQNFKTFEARLKTPIREKLAADDVGRGNIAGNYQWSFRPELATGENLDPNQLLNPQKPPKNWQVTGRNLYFGTSTYWGIFGYASIGITDILEQEHYSIQVALNGKYFRLLGFGYENQSQRRAWGYEFFNLKIPLNYLAYDVSEGNPRQPVLLNTVVEEWRASAFSFYPLDKFNRIEGQIEIRNRHFTVYGYGGAIANPQDVRLVRFFNDSNGWSFAASAAYVRDTVLYSRKAHGPLHGNALRLGLSFAPPMLGSGEVSFVSANLDARRYQRLSDGIVAAVRVAGLWSTTPNGDYILLGGAGTLRGYIYGSMVGNKVIYGSVELRLPFVDAVVFSPGIPFGPLRGLIFADAGAAKFNGEKLASQSGISAGFGIQFLPLNFTWSWRKLDNFKDRKYDFYLAYNF